MGREEEVRERRIAAAALAASATLSAAGILAVVTYGTHGPEPGEGHRSLGDVETMASIDWRIHQTMVTARVVATSRDGFPDQRIGPSEEGLARALSEADGEEGAGTGEGADPGGDPGEALNEFVEPKSDTPPELKPELPVHPHGEPVREPSVGSSDSARVGPNRSRMSEANVRARDVALAVAAEQSALALDGAVTGWGMSPNGGGMAPSPSGDGQGLSEEPALPSGESVETSSNDAAPSPRKFIVVGDEVDDGSGAGGDPDNPVVSEGLERSDRHLLFVWDNGAVRDPERGEELLQFAVQRGFDTLAIEATPVGYGDAALTSAFERFTADADALGIDTFALIGYPWFTVSPSAGLPGQPTSSLEGVAVLAAITATGLFDGVVDDSAPYGVEYEVGGVTQNWLFDEPGRAGLDLQSWLREAKQAVGTLPLLKTTPFWYDSHPDLTSITDLDGQSFLSLGHLIASEVDAMVVLAYRDELDGPNGILELCSGEMNMGPTILTVETGDLGPALDYLTFAEDGLVPMEDTLAALRGKVDGSWSFAGTGVHHYQPVKGLADDRAEKEAFAFIGLDSVTMQFGALADAYDSSLGRYYDQMVYQEAVGVIAGIGLGAIASNRSIDLHGGSLTFGDARPGAGFSVSRGHATIVTGEERSLAVPLSLEPVEPAENESSTQLNVRWNSEERISGSGSYKRIKLSSYAQLVIEGPAEIVVEEIRLGSQASIFCDTTNGPVTIRINETLQMSSSSWIAPTSLQARDLTIFYASATTIDMNHATRLLCDLYAPNALIRVGHQAEIYGRASALALEVQNEGELHLDVDLLRQ